METSIKLATIIIGRAGWSMSAVQNQKTVTAYVEVSSYWLLALHGRCLESWVLICHLADRSKAEEALQEQSRPASLAMLTLSAGHQTSQRAAAGPTKSQRPESRWVSQDAPFTFIN